MSFDSLYALHYDRFSGADYASYAAFFTEAARRFADVALREALDLGCGAGGLSAVLAGAGLDMVGLTSRPRCSASPAPKPRTGMCCCSVRICASWNCTAPCRARSAPTTA